MESEALRLGDPTFLNDGEAAAAMKTNDALRLGLATPATEGVRALRIDECVWPRQVPLKASVWRRRRCRSRSPG